MIFSGFGIDVHRLEAGQTIGQQHRADLVVGVRISQVVLLSIRDAEGLQVVETVRKENVFV